jgi:hypothetical protein
MDQRITRTPPHLKFPRVPHAQRLAALLEEKFEANAAALREF